MFANDAYSYVAVRAGAHPSFVWGVGICLMHFHPPYFLFFAYDEMVVCRIYIGSDSGEAVVMYCLIVRVKTTPPPKFMLFLSNNLHQPPVHILLL